ncbi:MAG TPA: PEPxxWA-CTERM sorting domain-containing protein, partial [Sphingomicrobium sp.]
AVPEPATWAMMLLGFGAIGVSMRRRKPVLAQLA